MAEPEQRADQKQKNIAKIEFDRKPKRTSARHEKKKWLMSNSF